MTAYGHFDDARREYVITRPDTPLPWLNYLGQDDFFGLCTNTAGGYTFWKDARLRRLTRYRYNNVPYDLGGRYLYVNDGGTVWNPGLEAGQGRSSTRYECRHGLGYTRIVGREGRPRGRAALLRPAGRERGGLEGHASATSRRQRKTPRLFSFQEFCFFEALNDMTNYQRTYSIGEVEVEGGARSTTRPSTASAATTTRSSPARGPSPASTPTATPSSASTRACTRRAVPFAGQLHGLAGLRLEPDRRPPGRPRPRARRGGELRLRPRLRRAGRRAQVRGARS